MSDSRSWLVLALVAGTGYLTYLLAPVITPFAIAGGIAYLTDPLVDRLERLSIRKWTVGRTLAVTIVFILLSALLVITVLVVLPILVRQFRQLVEQFPVYIDWLMDTAVPWVTFNLGLDDLVISSTEVREMLRSYGKELGGAAFSLVETVGKGGAVVMSLVTNLVLVPVVAFYLMRDWDRLVDGIQNLLPRRFVRSTSSLASEIDEVLGAFLRGQLMVMLALGIIYAIGLWLIGLQMAFLIGMTAGLLSIVPYLGSIVGLAIALGVALFQFGDLLHFVLVLVVFGVGQSMEGMVLTPKFVGDRIGLHPVAVIFAVLAGGQLFGFLGILLALPAAAALNVVVRHAHELYQHSALYKDELN